MPIYSYKCPKCGRVVDLLRPLRERAAAVLCTQCNYLCERQVESFQARTFEPYYDEGLGCDVHSAEERRVLLRERGLVEAGDPVHGGRNWDPKAPVRMEKAPPRGIRPKRAAKAAGDFLLETVDKGGKTLGQHRFSELPNGF